MEPEEETKEYCLYSDSFVRMNEGEADPAFIKKFKYEGPLAPFPPLGGKGQSNRSTDIT